MIIVIAITFVILSYFMPNFSSLTTKNHLTVLKSQVALIRSSISNQKSKNILLSNDAILSSLDDASIDKKDEKLFSKITDFSILSTNSAEKKLGSWTKMSSNSYAFYLPQQTVLFSLENESFVCKSSVEICKEVE